MPRVEIINSKEFIIGRQYWPNPTLRKMPREWVLDVPKDPWWVRTLHYILCLIKG